MVKNHLVRMITTSLLLAVMSICLTAVVASAHVVTIGHAGASVTTPASGVPVSNIVQKSGQQARYNPNTISCSVSTKLSFYISNQTAKVQYVVYNGQMFATIQPGKHQGFYIVVKGTYHLHLKGSASVLTVTAS